MEKELPIVLAPGVSFADWESDLQAALIHKGRLAHVFHNLDGIKPALRQIEPSRESETSDAEFEKISASYTENLARWSEGEIEAKHVLLRRLSPSVRPQNFRQMSAKQIFDTIATTREEGAAIPYETAVRNLLNTGFTTIEEYCNTFMQHYLSVNSAAESMVPHKVDKDSSNPFIVPHGLARFLFVMGTEGVEWLETWRETKVLDKKNGYTSLENLMSSLRQVGKLRSKTLGQPLVATGRKGKSDEIERISGVGGPDDYCVLCEHHHKNKNCFKQHAERKKSFRQEGKGNSKGKGKGKSRGKESGTISKVFFDSDEESDSDGETGSSNVARVSSASLHKNPLLYDTGASHHFVRFKNDFLSLNRLRKPFKFDQAIGTSKLTHQGISSIKIGEEILELSKSLYSPNSSCSIISAGRLKEQHGIVTARANELLVRMKNNQPVARLVAIENILFIKPLRKREKEELVTVSNKIAAPGVARVPHINNAHRWHQRLGHTSQQILKKTTQYSKGMEGIDFSDLATCETCHLSKAQRFISREPRPVSGEPLDEVFIDTIGKLTAAYNGYQYAVILTDSKTRMRWTISTASKEEIASHLVLWIKNQHHQYGKIVRVIFRDGGTEFNKIKQYCDEHNIRTDTSAPCTPEQNGAAEASNKVILRRARSMLIDARMPSWFWPWALEHSCFITNRLYCLRTKRVPIIDFLDGLRQPHHEKIDFSCLPRFGCRSYKLIEPTPGKFAARAEKGWFVGFPKYTSKNYLVYHPHWTQKQGWKWVETTTPHATFNGDIMFGDMLDSINQQRTASYWASENPLPVREVSASTQHLPRSVQTIDRFEGGISSLLDKRKAANPDCETTVIEELSLKSKQPLIPPPMTPTIPDIKLSKPDAPLIPSEVLPIELNEKQPPSANKKDLSISPGKSSESKPPAVPTISDAQWPEQSIENDGLLSSWKEITDDRSDYENENTSLSPSEKSDRLDLEDKESVAPYEDVDKFNEQDGTGTLVGPIESEEEVYDRIMTGWDEVPPVAGRRRQRSPEPQIVHSKRGRPVKKLDYRKLHHGKVVKADSDPKTWSEAMSNRDAKHWQKAANDEFQSLKDTGTIRIIKSSQLPKGRKIMKCKWVFKKKYLADGTLEKYRARCTVKGFTQRSGIDYKETYAPTPRPETGRIMLALAHRFGWHRCQGDVPAAFLNPDLDVDLYMELPEGFKRDGYIIHLRKGIYGLKQAAALWYDDVKAFLAELGMFPTTTDVCLYINKKRDLFVIVHIDDFQVMGPNTSKIESLMRALHKKYKLKAVKTDLFLGIHISNPDKSTLKLSQGQFARKLLERHGLENCKPVNSPLERLMEPRSSQCSFKTKTEYNSRIGGLQYLANNTRPDIAHAVNHLARFLVNPSLEHFSAAKRILRYISKDPERGTKFKRGKSKPILEAYSDADFAGDPITTGSTSGSLIRLASGPVSWRSRLQREVVLSTTGAEYLAATETCRQLQWVKSLIQELGLQDRIEGAERTNLYIDNQSTISLIKNHDNHKRSKHIALRNNYCRQQYQQEEITVVYVQSNQQLADSLTKSNSRVQIC